MGAPIPSNAVYGGTESNGNLEYVCRGAWRDAIHPGKLTNGGWCYIAYGQDEIKLPSYEVLTSSSTYWAAPNRYATEPVLGGRENNYNFEICRGALYIDRAFRGTEIGKYFSSGCQVSYGTHSYYIRNFEELYIR